MWRVRRFLMILWINKRCPPKQHYPLGLYNTPRHSVLCKVGTKFLFIFFFIYFILFYFLLWRCDPTRFMASSLLRFLDHTQRRTTVGRTPLDEWSARRRDLYLTTHDTHNRQTSVSPVGLEPTISAGQRAQTYALGRAATGTLQFIHYLH